MLTDKQLGDIRTLQETVEKQDGISLKLNWDMLRSRSTDSYDYFHYEGNQLNSFLGLYGFGSTVEICGMTHPNDRRNGYFLQLYREALEFIKRKDYKTILLNTPEASQSGQAFIQSVGAELSHIEYQMKWQGAELQAAKFKDVALRPATKEDLALLVQLDVEAFGVPEKDAIEMSKRHFDAKTVKTQIIEWNQEPVGKIRVETEKLEDWIYGFAMLPTMQGKGIGGKVLQMVIQEADQKGHTVHLEVAALNPRALDLYKRVGFFVVNAQQYYNTMAN